MHRLVTTLFRAQYFQKQFSHTPIFETVFLCKIQRNKGKNVFNEGKLHFEKENFEIKVAEIIFRI